MIWGSVFTHRIKVHSRNLVKSPVDTSIGWGMLVYKMHTPRQHFHRPQPITKNRFLAVVSLLCSGPAQDLYSTYFSFEPLGHPSSVDFIGRQISLRLLETISSSGDSSIKLYVVTFVRKGSQNYWSHLLHDAALPCFISRASTMLKYSTVFWTPPPIYRLSQPPTGMFDFWKLCSLTFLALSKIDPQLEVLIANLQLFKLQVKFKKVLTWESGWLGIAFRLSLHP